MNKINSLNIGLVQENPIVGDIKGNTNIAKKQIKSLVNNGSPDFIVFTEMFLTGYPPEDLLYRDDFLFKIEDALKEISELAKGTFICIGYPRKIKKKIYNAAGVFLNGNLIKEYFKQDLPNYSVFDEKRYFSAGKGPCVIDVKGYKVGLTICEDIWHSKAIRQSTKQGAEIIVNLNASPFDINKIDDRMNLLKKHTKKFKVPIIYANQVGGQDELVFDGGSMVISKDEECKVSFPSFETNSDVIEFNKSPSGVEVISSNNQLERQYIQDIYDALVLGTRDYVTKNRFPGAIIGSSGGIDSALTAAIACDALGSSKVKTYMMPFKYTADISIEDAELLSKNLGIVHNVIPIERIYEAFIDSLTDSFKAKKTDKSEENLQSRCRGVILMGISNKTGCIVLTTGNKSETAVGYSTLYGDTAGGFCVLKDVPKTLVYQLSRYRNSLSKVIPNRIIERPPTAELAPDQKDSDSLPDYSVLDQIIELYVEKDLGLNEIRDKGFDEEVVKKILRLIDMNEYKRRQGPIGVKISDKGFGKDRRYPITNHWAP
tara:strand:- start:11596 stop:13227 length:1632 start_codon:yes stop_codon:yes gene_type:complete